MSVFLRDDLIAWAGADPFAAAQAQQGQVYRDKEGRRTLRFELNGRGYFLKLHQGVGWTEIFKNLLQGRLPVLGAENEYRAIRALERLGIDTLAVAGFGRRGIDPARQLSFLITDELSDVESLEDVCARWPQQPPAPAFKRRLIARVAALSRLLHGAGINHRDYYLCHFLLEKSSLENAASGAALEQRRLYLMDLHRAQLRAHVPQRWQIKDLGGLYYSALDIGLTGRDILRFMRDYRQRPLRELLTREAPFWHAVRARAQQIYVRDHRRQPASSTWTAMEKTPRP
jgi:heptose I phosphotransferase